MNSGIEREALNLPDKKTGGIYDNEYQTGCVDGWNDCLDEVKAMNKAALPTEAQPEVTGAVAWRWGNEAAWLLTDEKPVSDDPSIHVEPLYPPSAIEAAVREKLKRAVDIVMQGGTAEGIARRIRALMASPQSKENEE